jgi:hypothetical protein
MKKNFRFYLFLLLFLLFIFLVVTIIFITFNSPMLCEGDSDKLTGIAKEVGDKVNTTLSGSNIQNNINANVDKPSINISNPDINIPSSVGTGIAQGASSIGIGATVVGGMRAMSHKTGGMTPGMRAAFVGFGGLIGGVAFASSNYINSSFQRNSSNGSKDGPFPAKSIIEEGDSIELVMNFLYFNLFISILILLLAVILLYFYKNKKEKFLIFIWIFLVLFGYLSLYLAYNLYKDIYVISAIYQKSTTISIINNYDSNIIDRAKTINNIAILCNLYLNGGIISILDLLFIFYVRIKVLNKNLKLLFIKRIFGERFYYYFMKIYSVSNKMGWMWIYYCILLLIFYSLLSMYFNYNLINQIDIITEVFEYTNNK